jgi:gluconolactonase
MSDYKMRVAGSGLGFVEGPVSLPDGRILFTDVGEGQLVLLDPATGDTRIFADTEGGPNGIAVGPDGYFYICNNGGMTARKENGRVIAEAGSRGDRPVTPCIQRVSPSGAVETLYTECNGRALVAPNDLVFDAEGGFYFTDMGHPQGELTDLGALHYALPDGSRIETIAREAWPFLPPTQPNGCALSPDGKTLYVAETVTARLWAWTIEAPGRLAPDPDGFVANGARFVHGAEGHALFDSLGVDGAGNICVATILRGGISVIRPDGILDSFIDIGDPFPTNICFGGPDLRKAYVTSSGTGRIVEIDWPRPGLRLNFWEKGVIAD